MKKLILLLTISSLIFSCQVKFVPTKSPTAIILLQQVQQDANNAFSISAYNDVAYLRANNTIDSLIKFDKTRAKAGLIIKQDYIIQDQFKSYQNEHKAADIISQSVTNVYRSYFKSVIDARIYSENSLK